MQLSKTHHLWSRSRLMLCHRFQRNAVAAVCLVGCLGISCLTQRSVAIVAVRTQTPRPSALAPWRLLYMFHAYMCTYSPPSGIPTILLLRKVARAKFVAETNCFAATMRASDMASITGPFIFVRSASPNDRVRDYCQDNSGDIPRNAPRIDRKARSRYTPAPGSEAPMYAIASGGRTPSV